MSIVTKNALRGLATALSFLTIVAIPPWCSRNKASLQPALPT
ncbi:MAG: hypothetical protein WBZ23_23440 [Pseudolabrys sp.]